MDHPITTVSVNALLDAVGPVCRGQPGIIIDDARPYYRYDDGTPLRTSRRHHRPQHRVIIWGPPNVRSAVIQAAQADANIAVIPVASRSEMLTVEADCIVLLRDPITPSDEMDAMVLSLLETGKNVLSIGAENIPPPRLREACQRGGTSIHRFDFHTTLMIERIVMTMVQGLSAVRHIRIVEALDLSTTPERRREATALGFGQNSAGLDANSDPTVIYNLNHVIATVAREFVRGSRRQVFGLSTHGVGYSRTPFLDRGARDRAGTVAAVCTIHSGFIDDRLFFTSEIWRYVGAENAYRGDDLPYGGFRGSSS